MSVTDTLSYHLIPKGYADIPIPTRELLQTLERCWTVIMAAAAALPFGGGREGLDWIRTRYQS